MAYLVLNCVITQFNLKGVHNTFIKNESFIIVLHTYVFAGTLIYVDVCTFIKFTNKFYGVLKYVLVFISILFTLSNLCFVD